MTTMRKALLFFAATFLFSATSFSQFYLGAKAGLTIPNLTAGGGNPVSSGWSSRLGPYFGAVAECDLSKHFSLQAELNFSGEGGKKDGEQAFPNPYGSSPKYLFANYNSVVRLNYLELPVMLKLNLPLSRSLSFFIGGGPYAGYLIGAKQVSTGSSYLYLDKNETQQSPLPPAPQSFDTTVDIKNQVNVFNAGIQGGIGLTLKTGKGKLVFTAGGNYGFLNIQKNDIDGTNDTGAATITLAYLVSL
jgi:hypothetical protein